MARERAAIRELERPGNAGQLAPQLGIDEVGDAHQPERRPARRPRRRRTASRLRMPRAPGEQDHGERRAEEAAVERHAALPDGERCRADWRCSAADRRTACSRCVRRARRRSPPRRGSRRGPRASSALRRRARAGGWRPAAWRTTRRTGCRRYSRAPYQWIASGPIWTITGSMFGKGQGRQRQQQIVVQARSPARSECGADHAAAVWRGQGDAMPATVLALHSGLRAHYVD